MITTSHLTAAAFGLSPEIIARHATFATPPQRAQRSHWRGQPLLTPDERRARQRLAVTRNNRRYRAQYLAAGLTTRGTPRQQS